MISGGLQHMKLNYDILSRENKAEMAMLDTTTAPNALKKQVICPFKHCMLSQKIPTTDFDHRRFSAPPTLLPSSPNITPLQSGAVKCDRFITPFTLYNAKMRKKKKFKGLDNEKKPGT